MSAFNQNGGTVNIGDLVTIKGTVVSYTGSGGTAQVTVQPYLTTSTFVAQANDMQAEAHPSDASHTATGISGQFFGVAGDHVSVLGKVTAISGSGNTATLTVTLTTSGLSISVPSGSVNSDNF